MSYATSSTRTSDGSLTLVPLRNVERYYINVTGFIRERVGPTPGTWLGRKIWLKEAVKETDLDYIINALNQEYMKDTSGELFVIQDWSIYESIRSGQGFRYVPVDKKSKDGPRPKREKIDWNNLKLK